ncbi:MAG: MFS transporter [Bacteroidales bacterium]|jgi:FHS family L-fucose permease-like MFS transporter|nr:MFS transporter [Bacteroidales bacterium]
MSKNKQILPIIVMIFLFGIISFVTNLASPMGDVLKHQFILPNWLAQLGVFANFIAYAILGVPSGILLQKMGYKKTSLLAVSVGFVGVGIQTLSGTLGDGTSAYCIYLTGAFIAGFSMCLLNTVVNPMLNSIGGGGKKGNQLVQLGTAFNSFAGTAVIMLVGVLVGDITKASISSVYPVMYIALGVFAFAFLVILFTRIQNPVLKTVAVAAKRNLLKVRHFLLGAIAIFFYVGIEVGTADVLFTWLADKDLNLLGDPLTAATIAGFVAGTYWFLMLIGRLVGAAIGGKVSSRVMLSTVASIGLLLVLLAIFSDVNNKVNLPVLMRSAEGALTFGTALVPINAFYLVLVGLCMSVMWGGIFNLAVEGLGSQTEKASGIFMTLCCGGAILPLLQNYIVDISSYATSYWVIVAGLAYLLYYALVGCKISKN